MIIVCEHSEPLKRETSRFDRATSGRSLSAVVMHGGNGRAAGRSNRGECDNTIINWIMLRYRPIAPKPTFEKSCSGGSPAAAKNEIVTTGRTKRKYVRVKNNIKCRKNKKTEREDISDEKIVKLPFFQAMRNQTDTSDVGSSENSDVCVMNQVQEPPRWINFDKADNNVVRSVGVSDPSDRTRRLAPVRVVESRLVVEGLTRTTVETEGLGFTDEEKMENLSMDACPGLISDGCGKVKWVNQAYMRMLGGQVDGEEPPEVLAWLVSTEKLPTQYQAFACRVRVVYTWQKEKYSNTVPCDVWKMEFGGFAWRLDVRAALSLGR